MTHSGNSRWEGDPFHFQALLASPVDAILVIDPSLAIRLASPSTLSVFGYAESELVGQSLSLLCGRAEDFEEQGPLRCSPEGPVSREIDCRRRDGSIFPGEIRLRSLPSSEGAETVSGSMVWIRDISPGKTLETDLARERERWIVTLRSLEEAVIVADGDGKVTFMNPVAEQLTGRSFRETAGRGIEMVFSIEDEAGGGPVPNPVRKCLADGKGVGFGNPVVLVAGDGKRRPVEERVSPLSGPDQRVTGVVLVFRDVTEKAEMERRLAHQAQFDYLTRIPNRVLFHDRLEQALVRAKRHDTPLALLYIDLDSFKDINDTMGHESGDLVLVESARRLQDLVRKEDTVARMGGDEFTVILDGFDSGESVLSTIQRILQALCAPLPIGGRDVRVSASVGVAVCPRDGDDPSELLRKADIALYKAKERRSNAVEFFSHEMTEALDRRMTFANDLKRALAQSELFLEFQPIVHSDSNRPAGFEALVRWNHPGKGPLLPEEFVGYAESTDLIGPIGEWVLSEACRQASRWLRETGESPFLSVNVSGKQLQTPSFFPSIVRSALFETGLDPERLELEFTESVFLRKESRPVFDALKEIGVRIVIDDFGKGYSSLGYLASFPVDRIKIDREFVAEIGQDPRMEAIVQAILSLGSDLSISVIGEGAEKMDQIQFLKRNGCSLIQGFHYSRPVSSEGVFPFLEKDFQFSGFSG